MHAKDSNMYHNKNLGTGNRPADNIFYTKEKKEDVLTRAKKICQKYDKKIFEKKNGISETAGTNQKPHDEKKDFLLLIKEKINDEICHEKVAPKNSGKPKRILPGNMQNSLSRIRNLFETQINHPHEDGLKTDRGPEKHDHISTQFKEATNRSFTTRKVYTTSKHDTLQKSPVRVPANTKNSDKEEKFNRRIHKEKIMFTSVAT